MTTETDVAVREAAALLRVADDTRTPCPPLRVRYPKFTVEDAYAVQLENVHRAVESGARIVGRKIGLTSRAVQTQLGVACPDFGTLLSDMAFGDDEEIPWSRLLQPKAEAEIALVLEHDLPFEQVTVADVIRATAFALPAIEVVGSRIDKWDIRIVDTVADNASSSVFVLGGSPRKLDAFDGRLCGMVLERRGEPVSVGAGAACLGHPLNAAVWLARKMAQVGTPLKAGDIVLTGALGPMVNVSPGDVLEARIHGLGSVRATFGGEP